MRAVSAFTSTPRRLIAHCSPQKPKILNSVCLASSLATSLRAFRKVIAQTLRPDGKLLEDLVWRSGKLALVLQITLVIIVLALSAARHGQCLLNSGDQA
jgi:hypothetical protein